MKKFTALFIALIMSAACLTACNDSSASNTENSVGNNTSSTSSISSDSSSNTDSSSAENSDYNTEMFADGDFKDVSSEKENATITLSGNTGTISDTTRGSSGSQVTITSKGIYRVIGSSENVSIVIKDSNESGNIYLILDNVTMKNSTACINVESCDKLIIQCVGENNLTYTNTSSDEKIDGAIYSKNDVTVNGSGKLNITSSLHGIVCKEDLKITGSEVSVNAENIGIQGSDSVKFGGGSVDITSGHDGIQVSNKNNNGYFYIENTDLTITTNYDGIAVTADDDNAKFTGSAEFRSGSLKITSGGGSDNSKNSSTSQKGIKCHGDITFSGASVDISSADDAVHSNGNITVKSGNLALSTSDDGMTAKGDININDGTVIVSKSYEAIEAANVVINDGAVNVFSSDDGINTSGGSDTSSSDDDKWSSDSSGASLTINGGYIYINSEGDGLDSNGSIYVTGGTVIIEGSSASGNGAIDKGDGSGCVASITGGTVLAIGSADMAINFDSGTQCSALVSVSSENGAEISVNDGSAFSFTASKGFSCAVYSSPNLEQGKSYTLSAGSSSSDMDFSSGLYYSNVSSKNSGGKP